MLPQNWGPGGRLQSFEIHSKSARNNPENAIRQQVKAEGLSVEGYFLVAIGDHFLVSFQDLAGAQYAIMDDGDVNNFAIAQYLIQHGAPVYQSADEVPACKKTSP